MNFVSFLYFCSEFVSKTLGLQKRWRSVCAYFSLCCCRWSSCSSEAVSTSCAVHIPVRSRWWQLSVWAALAKKIRIAAWLLIVWRWRMWSYRLRQLPIRWSPTSISSNRFRPYCPVSRQNGCALRFAKPLFSVPAQYGRVRHGLTWTSSASCWFDFNMIRLSGDCLLYGSFLYIPYYINVKETNNEIYSIKHHDDA